MRVRHPLSLVVIASLVSAPSYAQTAAASDPVRWRGTLAAGKTIEVIGVLGGVRAVPTDGREVVVEARQDARVPEDSVTFEVVPHADGVVICAKYPMRRVRDDEDGFRLNNGRARDGWEGGPEECTAGDVGRVNLRRNRTRVEWTVRVPAGVRLVARTVQGDIEAVDLRGDVDANTVDGSVEVTTTGVAEAATVSGDIRVRMGAAPSRGLDFRTVSGAIDVTLPHGANATVRASTMTGQISADFPLERRGGENMMGGGRMQGTLGSGGPTLYAQTLSGRIRFRTADPR